MSRNSSHKWTYRVVSNGQEVIGWSDARRLTEQQVSVLGCHYGLSFGRVIREWCRFWGRCSGKGCRIQQGCRIFQIQPIADMSLSRLPLRLSVFSTFLFNSFWLILARGSLLTPARLERRAFYSNVSQCWCNVSMPFYCMTLFPAADCTDSIVPRFFLFVIFKLPRGYIYRGSKYNNNNLQPCTCTF